MMTSLENRTRSRIAGMAIAALLLAFTISPASAQVISWSADDGGGAGSGVGDFFDSANWATGVIPIGNNKAPKIDGGGTAIITAAGTGAGIDTEALIAGDASGSSGTYQMDSGYLIVYDAAGSVLGNNAGGDGSLILNGGMLDFGDVPGNGASGGASSLGISNAPGSTGKLEMHNDAVLRSLDGWALGAGGGDVAHGTPDRPASTIIMDGTSQASLGGNVVNRGAMNMTLSDSATLTLGNSKGAGDATGSFEIGTGVFNMGARQGTAVEVLIEDSAVFNASSFYNQKAKASITIRDNGEFNIFNTATGGTETDFKSQNYLGRENFDNNDPDQMASTVITLEGSGRFTVDSNPDPFADPSQDPFPDGSPDLISTAGLILSSGDDEPLHNGDDSNQYRGGLTLIDVKDSAEFSVVQGLWMTLGYGPTASSTLKVTGPDATVTVGDLIMAEIIDQTLNGDEVTFGDPLFESRPGTAELHSVITGPSHSVIQVTDDARISNGELVVELSGYSPEAGDSYTLLQTGTSDGIEGEFKSVDLSLAPLGPGLSWDLVYNPDSVLLSVLSDTPELSGDYNNDGSVDAADYTVWRDSLDSTTDLAADGNGNGVIDQADYDIWEGNYGATTLIGEAATSAVPESASLVFAVVCCGAMAYRRL